MAWEWAAPLDESSLKVGRAGSGLADAGGAPVGRGEGEEGSFGAGPAGDLEAEGEAGAVAEGDRDDGGAELAQRHGERQ
jgi:hypothetical protein